MHIIEPLLIFFLDKNRISFERGTNLPFIPMLDMAPGQMGKHAFLVQLGKYEMQKYQRGRRCKDNIK